MTTVFNSHDLRAYSMCCLKKNTVNEEYKISKTPDIWVTPFSAPIIQAVDTSLSPNSLRNSGNNSPAVRKKRSHSL